MPIPVRIFLDEREYPRSEIIFRDVVARFTKTLSAEHMKTGIARIKLGRSLLKQRRYRDAEIESRAGCDILAKQANPNVSWLQNARTDLAEEYDALEQPDLASHFRAQGQPQSSAALVPC